MFLSEEKKIRVCDTFGWGDEHFRQVFDLLMQGKLPDGYTISDPVDKYINRDLITSYDQRPHAVFIVFPATMINNKKEIRNFIDVYRKITERYGLSPFFNQ